MPDCLYLSLNLRSLMLDACEVWQMPLLQTLKKTEKKRWTPSEKKGTPSRRKRHSAAG